MCEMPEPCSVVDGQVILSFTLPSTSSSKLSPSTWQASPKVLFPLSFHCTNSKSLLCSSHAARVVRTGVTDTGALAALL